MARTVIAVFESVYIAKKAIWELLDLGFPRDRIDLVTEQTRESTRNLARPHAVRSETVMDELRTGGSIGAGIGGSLGIAGAMLVGFGSLHLPFLAAITGVPPTAQLEAAALTGVGLIAGAIAGSLFGGLLGLGIPETEIQQYAKTVRHDRVTVMVVADWDAVDGTIEVLEHYNPLEIRQKTIVWQKAGVREKKLAERALHVKTNQDRMQ